MSRRHGPSARIRGGASAAVGFLFAGCSGPQSALDPAGPAAAAIDQLGRVMWIGTGFVLFLVTLAMLPPFLIRGVRLDRRVFLWGGGVALPAITVTALLAWSSGLGGSMRRPGGELSITAVGRMFWWEIRYERAGRDPVVSANEVRLPVGRPVEFKLRSEDVIHSFWIPSLGGKTDMTPGRVSRMTLEALRPGVYRGQCAEFCGPQHAMMAFPVVAAPPEEFEAWLAREAQPAREPTSDFLKRGRELFVSAGCGACHTVRGVSTGAPGFGPDLTHIGSRRAIVAGSLEPGVGNLAAWIVSAQHIKPGNRMPSFDRLDGPSLRALAQWLESLD